MCREQELRRQVKGQRHSPHLKFIHRLQWNMFVSDP